MLRIPQYEEFLLIAAIQHLKWGNDNNELRKLAVDYGNSVIMQNKRPQPFQNVHLEKIYWKL